MRNKGFFDILFVLIMFALLLPNTSITNKSEIITSNIQEIEDISLIVDNIIVDALADQTYVPTSFMPAGYTFFLDTEYDDKIQEYLNSFKNDSKNYLGTNCYYNVLDSNIGGAAPLSINYYGEIEISCSKRNKVIVSDITKILKFSKDIVVSYPGPAGICNIKIKDNYNLDHVQLDQNGTYT